MVRRIAAGLIVAFPLLGSCVSYNEDCSPVIENPDSVVGTLAEDVDITKDSVRTSDNLVGQMVAESYSGEPDGGYLAQVGMENSGDIRSEGVCETIDTLPAGPVLAKTLAQVLPLGDNVGAISIDPVSFKQVMEHSVAALVNSSTTVPNTPSGQFLQISGVAVSANCALVPEGPDGGGQRITRIVLVDPSEPPGGTLVYDADAGYVSGAPIRVATNSYVLSGGDGYVVIANLDAGAAMQEALPGLTFQVASAWFALKYLGSDEQPSLGMPFGDGGRAQPAGGWNLTDCQ